MIEFVEKLIGRLEDARQECKKLQKTTDDAYGYMKQKQGIDVAKEIVKQVAEEYNNGFCEWKLDGVYLLCQHNTELVISCLEEEKHRYTYCPYCGKKIKVVE